MIFERCNEDISVMGYDRVPQPKKDESLLSQYSEDEDREMYLVAIQVYGKKLLQHDISNGMLKTIYYIVELFTMSDNSLVLIDEFENGLGVNCIDLLSEILLFERKDLQFIITSHHPKIINGIEQNRWEFEGKI